MQKWFPWLPKTKSNSASGGSGGGGTGGAPTRGGANNAELLPCAALVFERSLTGSNPLDRLANLVSRTAQYSGPTDETAIRANNSAAVANRDNRILWWSGAYNSITDKTHIQTRLQLLQTVYGSKLKEIFICVNAEDSGGAPKNRLSTPDKEILDTAADYGRIRLVIVTRPGTTVDPRLETDAQDVARWLRYGGTVYIVDDSFGGSSLDIVLTGV